jgi:pyridoxal phosphate enzyme (YggS family)
MTLAPEKLEANLSAVRGRIARAAHAAGRRTDSVRLVAVTKQVDEAAARQLVALGVTDLGESRPQELWRKRPLVSGPARWHLIGPLQRNKARRTLPLVHLIHSVDSVELLRRLDELAVELNVEPAVLLEVNASGEAAKHGFGPNDLPTVMERVAELRRVKVEGLMTMAAYDADPQCARRTFAALREWRDRLAAQAPPNCRLTELSMGMSGDFEVAIAEGATIVRIGSALFSEDEVGP